MQNRHIASLRSTWGSGTIDPQDRDRCFAFVWVLFVLEPRVRSLYARTGRYSIMCMNANPFACPSIIHLSALVFKFWDWWGQAVADRGGRKLKSNHKLHPVIWAPNLCVVINVHLHELQRSLSLEDENQTKQQCSISQQCSLEAF